MGSNRSEDKIRIAIFIDWVIPKNKIQIDSIHKLGYSVSIFVNKFKTSSTEYFHENDEYTLLRSNFFSRIAMIYNFLKENHKLLHHLEIYPGGRFSFIYVLLSKFFNVPVICVERGDLLYYKKGGYGIFTRLSMWVCYKLSEIIWYREPYMLDLLKKMNVKNIFFLHNAVEHQDENFPQDKVSFLKERNIDFLWVNRIIPERRSDWFVHILSKEYFKKSKNILAGILEKSAYEQMQESIFKNSLDNLTVFKFVSDPSKLYKKAKFFVLPANVIFANNSLLEAMSYGVVPLVAKQSGAEMIVEDGVNGFVFDYNEASFEKAMRKALDTSDDKYINMSIAAQKKIRSHFSYNGYLNNLLKLYNQFNN